MVRMKPKILFITHTPPPVHGVSVMGQYIHDSVVINQAFDCHFIKPSNATSLTVLKKIQFDKIFFLFTFHYLLLKTYRKFKPKLCYFTPSTWGFSFYRDFITVCFLKLLKAKIVIHFHNTPNHSFRNKWYNKLLYRIFFKNIDVIFLAPQLSSVFEEYINKKSIHICANGVSINLDNEIQKNERYTFLFLSNIMKEKGVWTLLEACYLLKQKGYVFDCNLVGQWNDITESVFTRRVKQRELTDCVHYYGAKYGDEKKVFFQSSNVFVFPSNDEALSLVLLEAMSFALPCISTFVGGLPAIIKDSQTGFLISPNDHVTLAEKMIYFIENQENGIEMGKNGRSFFEENFTIQKFEERFVDIINKMI